MKFSFWGLLRKQQSSVISFPDLDIHSEEFQQNCYVYYEKFFKLNEDIIYLEKSGCYLVYSYQGVQSVLNSHNKYFSDNLSSVDSVLLGNNGTEHTRNKKIIFQHYPVLKKESVYNAAEFSVKCCKQLMERIGYKSPLNLVDEVINPYTFAFTMHELGFQELPSEMDVFSKNVPADKVTETIKLIFSDWDLLLDMIENNLQPESSSASLHRLISLINQGDKYSKEEIRKFIRLFILAGAETTSSLIASVVYVLLTQPQHIGKIKFNPVDLDKFMNEVLRLYSPAQFTFRKTENEVSLFNKKIPAGSIIAVAIGAANRDPSVFPNSSYFETERTEKHIAFGIGKHKCVGEHLSVFIAKQFLKHFLPVIEESELVSQVKNHNTLFTFKFSEINLGRK